MNRQDFPILERLVHGHPLVYLDNAATTQKPQCVIDAISEEYLSVNANVHRGVHYLSQQATELHESARHSVCRFINAHSPQEIVFTRGTTESLNLMAFSYGERFLSEGDEVILTQMEHHSNIVPWQMLRDRKGVVLRIAPIDERGALKIEEVEKLFSARTRLLSICHVSNVLGTVPIFSWMPHRAFPIFPLTYRHSIATFSLSVVIRCTGLRAWACSTGANPFLMPCRPIREEAR